MSVISIGTFDGIHLGHRSLILRMMEIAQELDMQSVIISFYDHPTYTLKSPNAPPLLCLSPVKKRELERLGIDEVDLMKFTSELAATSAEDFLESIVNKWHPKVIVVGYDSHFGAGRRGDREFLEHKSEQYGYRVEYIPPLLFEGKPVSSSTIRQALSDGRIDDANELLGRRYRLLGKVVQGLGKGRDFGFPTANVALDNPHQLVPKEGLYLTISEIRDTKYFGLTNIGKSPTVKTHGIVEIETFLIDFKGNLYGDEIEVELIKYLREEKMFANTDELISAMNKDLAHARELIGEMSQ
ncbi:MAG: bifunctional riboflavin kinase/FAD synthetase [Candidatus Cloacimonetes bacterium]|jgi:riboflavin kinase/FMN adenylyltransferase|nr:bifunctional riboflavin kinase/FAD synthetase [Candidatus Cloacimonadota bacterium]